MMWSALATVALVMFMAISNIILYFKDKKNKLSLVVGVSTIILVLATLFYIIFQNHPAPFQ